MCPGIGCKVEVSLALSSQLARGVGNGVVEVIYRLETLLQQHSPGKVLKNAHAQFDMLYR